MRVEILDVALDEAAEAAAWYEAEIPALGDEFVTELDRAVVAISEQPEAWPTVALARRKPARRFVLSRFPYAVVYVLRKDHALIVAIAHGRRRPLYWADRVPHRG